MKKEQKQIVMHLGFTRGASFAFGLAAVLSLLGRYTPMVLGLTFVIIGLTMLGVTIINQKNYDKQYKD